MVNLATGIIENRSHCPLLLATTLTPAHESIVIELRRSLLLSLDDLLAVTHESKWCDVAILLLFMLLPINNKELMGEYISTKTFNRIAWTTVIVMVVLTLSLVVTSVV